MPHLFLNYREDDVLFKDAEGRDYTTLDAARGDAVRGARDIIAEQIRQGEPIDGARIEITDAQGDILEIVFLKDVITRKPEA